MTSQHAGHEGHDDHAAVFGRLLWIMTLIAVPTVAASGTVADLFGYQVPGVLAWLAPAGGTILFLWGGKPFYTGALAELRDRQPGMMLLITTGITVAFAASWAATLGLVDADLEFWWELALLVVVMLLGHWVEMRSLARSSSALESLAELLPEQAERVAGERIVRVALEELATDDIVVVRPGSRVPADREVVSGSAAIDESMLTGESRPVQRETGARVVAGSIATDSALRVRVTAVGEETALAGIRRLVAQAQESSSRAQRLADRAAALLFWYALGAAAITAVVWLLVAPPDQAIARVITVLVIACPHALGLAIPLVVAIATERAARGGVLVADRIALEQMRSVDVVVFDKTGTLSTGIHELYEISAAAGWDEAEVLGLAAAAEGDSEHPLARTIRAAAEERGLEVGAAEGFRVLPGTGVRARVGQHDVAVDGPQLLADEDGEALAGTQPWDEAGRSVLHVLVDGEVAGRLRSPTSCTPSPPRRWPHCTSRASTSSS